MSETKCDACGNWTAHRVHLGTNVYCNRCFGLANTSQPTPSDDGEPITAEWFESEYGRCDCWLTRLVKLSVTIHDKVAIITTCDCCEGEVHRWLEGVKTRGQLRQLLAALGWRGEERR